MTSSSEKSKLKLVTTAIVMTNSLYHLLRNPAKLHCLRSELSSVLPPPMTETGVKDAIASYDSVRHLPYFRAVLDESLRLTPPPPSDSFASLRPKTQRCTAMSSPATPRSLSQPTLLTATQMFSRSKVVHSEALAQE
jgi:hypothetical protein